MPLHFAPLDPDFVATVRAGGPDANGQPPEIGLSDGDGYRCRSCLGVIPKGDAMLLVAARPFPALQPYAETGPIFICAKDCAPWPGQGMPPSLKTSADYLLKGYSADHRIIYGTGRIVPQPELESYAEALLARADVAYVDVRSSRNNCFQTRITRTQ